jgi:hypothetical protein
MVQFCALDGCEAKAVWTYVVIDGIPELRQFKHLFRCDRHINQVPRWVAAEAKPQMLVGLLPEVKKA